MASTANIDQTARTARQMAQAQRDSLEAIAENLAATQRRTIGIAEGGLEFMRLQEENARAAQEFFANGVRLLKLEQRNAEFVQGWMGEAVEVMREQTEHNVRTAEVFGRGLSTQQEGMRALTQGWVRAYRDFYFPFSYLQEGMRTFQRATRQGLRVAEEITERTEDVLRQTEKVTHEAELRTAVLGALKSTDYEGLSVGEISKRIEGLPTEQLEKVREFEKNHKNRESLIEHIDRKIRANDS